MSVFISFKDMLLEWPYPMPQNGDCIVLKYTGPLMEKVIVKYKQFTLDEKNNLKHVFIVCGTE